MIYIHSRLRPTPCVTLNIIGKRDKKHLHTFWVKSEKEPFPLRSPVDQVCKMDYKGYT